MSWLGHIAPARAYTLVTQDHDTRDTESQLTVVMPPTCSLHGRRRRPKNLQLGRSMTKAAIMLQLLLLRRSVISPTVKSARAPVCRKKAVRPILQLNDKTEPQTFLLPFFRLFRLYLAFETDRHRTFSMHFYRIGDPSLSAC